MRLFFAVNLPDEIIARVAAVQQALRAQIGEDGVTWTRPAQFHYTLKFLGDQTMERAQKAVEAAQAAWQEQPPFTLSLGGVGAFPNNARPGTIWIGATEGVGAMADLALRLDADLARQGFPKEKRPLKAHLTLARIKTYRGEAAAARALKEPPHVEAIPFTVDRFALMESRLKPSGSEYYLIEEFMQGSGSPGGSIF